MSDTYFRYVPVDPEFRPSFDAASNAVEWLSEKLPAEAIRSSFTEVVEFIDAGENWEGVHCPLCGADAESWWGDAMDQAYETQFSVLVVEAKCCGAPVSLNELRYGWPVAFGSFVIEVVNPDGPGLQPEDFERFKQILGSEVREIRAHV